MKKIILAASKTYEHNGCSIYDNGYGYDVYKDGKKVNKIEYATTEEAEQFIDEELQDVTAASINNPTRRALENLCKEHGYELYYAYVTNYSNHHFSTVSISVSVPNDASRFTPEVYIDDFKLGDRPNCRVSTTSYGSINWRDYEEFVHCVNNAAELIDELYNFDFDGLEVVEE